MHLTLRVGLDIIMKCSDFVSVEVAEKTLTNHNQYKTPCRAIIWISGRMTAEDRDMRFDSSREMLAHARASKYCVEQSWLCVDCTTGAELIGIHVGGQDPAEDDPRYEGHCDEGPNHVDIQD
jgi:hypothetical protein